MMTSRRKQTNPSRLEDVIKSLQQNNMDLAKDIKNHTDPTEEWTNGSNQCMDSRHKQLDKTLTEEDQVLNSPQATEEVAFDCTSCLSKPVLAQISTETETILTNDQENHQENPSENFAEEWTEVVVKTEADEILNLESGRHLNCASHEPVQQCTNLATVHSCSGSTQFQPDQNPRLSAAFKAERPSESMSRLHTGLASSPDLVSKIYVCNDCGIRFSHRGVLEAHQSFYCPKRTQSGDVSGTPTGKRQKTSSATVAPSLSGCATKAHLTSLPSSSLAPDPGFEVGPHLRVLGTYSTHPSAHVAQPMPRSYYALPPNVTMVPPPQVAQPSLVPQLVPQWLPSCQGMSVILLPCAYLPEGDSSNTRVIGQPQMLLPVAVNRSMAFQPSPIQLNADQAQGLQMFASSTIPVKNPCTGITNGVVGLPVVLNNVPLVKDTQGRETVTGILRHSANTSSVSVIRSSSAANNLVSLSVKTPEAFSTLNPLSPAKPSTTTTEIQNEETHINEQRKTSSVQDPDQQQGVKPVFERQQSETALSKLATDEGADVSQSVVKKFTCPACEVKFSVQSTFEAHKRFYCRVARDAEPAEASENGSGADENDHICPFCDYATTSSSRLNLHVKVFLCSTCGYKGYSLRGIKSHLKVHRELCAAVDLDNDMAVRRSGIIQEKLEPLQNSSSSCEPEVTADSTTADEPTAHNDRHRPETSSTTHNRDAIFKASPKRKRRYFASVLEKDQCESEGFSMVSHSESGYYFACNTCSYQSQYKGNIRRHISVVHKSESIPTASSASSTTMARQSSSR